MTPAEWSLLLLLSLLWGGSFMFVKVAVAEVPPLTLAACRTGLAAGVLWLAMLVLRPAGRAPRWQDLLVMSLINNVIPMTLIFWGQQSIAAGLAAILNGTTPLFGVALAHFLTADEKMTVARVAGVVTGIAGVVVIVGPAAFQGDSPLLPQLAVLAAALSYGFAAVFSRRFRNVAALPTATAQLGLSGAILLPVALLADGLPAMPGPAAAWSVVGLAVLSTALGYTIFFRVLATAGGTNIMLVTLLIPPSAALLGWLALGEAVGLRQVAGFALIAAGLAVIDGRALRLLAARRPDA
ncbi:MAG: DMT family transporter [Thalassobaculales bacterium]